MEKNKKSNCQMQINDLIDDAIANALTRREDGLLAVSEEEAAMIAGGTGVQEAAKIAVNVKPDITIAGFKPVEPICPPVKPTKPPVKPICPPIIAGLIALPDDQKLA